MAKSEKIVYCGTGRRKSSIARVRLIEGTGKITVNGKDLDEYFGLETLKVIVRQPNTTDKLQLQIQQINLMLFVQFKVEDLQVKLEQSDMVLLEL